MSSRIFFASTSSVWTPASVVPADLPASAFEPALVGFVAGARFAAVLLAGLVWPVVLVAAFARLWGLATVDWATRFAPAFEAAFVFAALLRAALALGFLGAAALAVADLAALVELALGAALMLEPLVVAALVDLLAGVLVAGFLLDPAFVGPALVDPALVGAALVALVCVPVLRAAVLETAAFAVCVAFVPPLAFPAAADLRVTRLEDEFAADLAVLAVEFVAFFAAVLVVLAFVALPTTRLSVLADTVARDRAAADTFLRPAESAADTATQTPA
jgi:hypothetical protein